MVCEYCGHKHTNEEHIESELIIKSLKKIPATSLNKGNA